MDHLTGKDLAGAETPKDIRIPDTSDLFDALEHILWFWPSVYVQLVKESQPAHYFDLCRSVKLTGQYQGLVILKTSQRLGDVLARALLEDRLTNSEDAFNEFANMFCGHIMNKIRTGGVSFRHFLPIPISNMEKPPRPAEARMTVAIESIILEVELWIDRHSMEPEPV